MEPFVDNRLVDKKIEDYFEKNTKFQLRRGFPESWNVLLVFANQLFS